MKKYIMCGIDVRAMHKTKNGIVEIRQEAKLVSDIDLLLRDVEKFFDDLKRISRLLQRSISRNDELKITFYRFCSEDGEITRVREATYKGFGSDIAENEGCYLVDSRNIGEYDFWLDGNADLFQCLRNFCDNQSYWSTRKTPV